MDALFDTARYREELTEGGGFSPEQTRTLSRALATAAATLPSKEGFDAFRAEVKLDVAGVRAEVQELRSEMQVVRREIHDIRTDMITFKAEVKGELEKIRRELSDRLSDQTWRLMQAMLAAVTLNVAAMCAIAFGLYHILKP